MRDAPKLSDLAAVVALPDGNAVVLPAARHAHPFFARAVRITSPWEICLPEGSVICAPGCGSLQIGHCHLAPGGSLYMVETTC